VTSLVTDQIMEKLEVLSRAGFKPLAIFLGSRKHKKWQEERYLLKGVRQLEPMHFMDIPVYVHWQNDVDFVGVAI